TATSGALGGPGAGARAIASGKRGAKASSARRSDGSRRTARGAVECRGRGWGLAAGRGCARRFAWESALSGGFRLQAIECAANVLEDLGVDVGRELVAHDVPIPRWLDHIGLSQHAEVLTRGRPAPAEDAREIARRELVIPQSAHDLETGPVAEHVQKTPHPALGHRRQRLSLRGRDRGGIYGAYGRRLHCSDFNQPCRFETVLYASDMPVTRTYALEALRKL